MNNFSGSIKKFFSNNKFRYGGYSILIVVVGIALVILVNYGLSVLNDKFDLRIDTTQNKKYSLTDQTKKVATGLTKDIYIYTTYTTSNEDKDVTEILNKFKSLSGHVFIQNVDPDMNPVFMKKFETSGQSISSGEVIVSDKENKLFRVLDENALYQITYDSSGNATKSQIKAEGAVVTAVNYIELGYIPTVYLVQGHGEPSTTTLSDISTAMSASNYNFVSVDISQTPDKIKAGDVIVIFDPQKDITDAERDILKPLMQKGGRFFFLLDPQYSPPGAMPNIESLLRLYDISLKSGVVIEGSSTNMISPQAPNAVVPVIQTHDITAPITTSGISIVLPNSGAITLPDSPPDSSMTITSLLKTSDKAYLKSYETLTAATKIEDLAQKSTDEAGPFDLAAAVQKTNGSNADDDVKFVVTYDTIFASTSSLMTSYENQDFFMNSVAWMRNADKDIYVRPKSISTPVLNISSMAQLVIIALVSVLLIPLAMMVIGIVIYQRRKHL